MNDSLHPTPPPVPRWLRVLAVATALLTLPLVTVGAEVTTKRAGMVDPVGLRKPWVFIEYVLTTPSDQLDFRFLIEHGHRQIGFLVGMCCIVLVAGLMLQTTSWRYRALGWVALLAVSFQGVLGILRVNWDLWAGPELATVHGCFAQLAFATLATVAVMLSRTWNEPVQAAPPGRAASLALVLLVYTQIVFGAITRHLPAETLAQRFHVYLAFLAVATLALLVWRLREAGADRATMTFALVLAAMVVVQPLLGIEAWMRRFGPDRPADALLPDLVPSSPWLDLFRTSHHVVGTLIFATSVSLAVMLRRPVVQPAADLPPVAVVPTSSMPARPAEGSA